MREIRPITTARWVSLATHRDDIERNGKKSESKHGEKDDKTGFRSCTFSLMPCVITGRDSMAVRVSVQRHPGPFPQALSIDDPLNHQGAALIRSALSRLMPVIAPFSIVCNLQQYSRCICAFSSQQRSSKSLALKGQPSRAYRETSNF